ncbi:3-methyl-2-oxobutanoate hydroxymethyltransferase [Poseidonibacter sp.]|uniref:3-methyl-2-oxobutanoate hydroxymethyltransferase n=1 Tax=Poseidonibacter sp. TaxID=2321188 RepID=UPI003C747B29
MNNKFTVTSFKKYKLEKEKITMITAYDFTTTQLVEEAGIDTILVGESLGMVMLGYDTTLKVTMDDMIHHTKAVVRGAKNALVIGDMPFLSYHVSVEDTIINAGRFIKEAGAHAVKLEGGRDVVDKIEALVRVQIPVIGHLGLTPQSVNMFGGFKVQGKSLEDAKKILDDAKLLEAAGVCAIVLECVPEPLAKLITESISVPTIGIGAGGVCDGQVLVIQDVLGMYKDLQPKFVKKYKDLGQATVEGISEYIKEVKSGVFPEEKHTFKMKDEILEKLY